MQALLESRAPAITIVGKTSDFHVTEVLRVSLEENLAMIADTVRYLREAGRDVIYDAEHFFDGWKINAEYAAQTDPRRRGQPEPKWSCCATPTAARMPEEIASLTREAIAALDVPVGIHCHNDCELAVANSLAARRRRRRAGAGDDQRPRRTLRQCRFDLGRRQPGAEEAGLRSAATRRASSI